MAQKLNDMSCLHTQCHSNVTMLQKYLIWSCEKAVSDRIIRVQKCVGRKSLQPALVSDQMEERTDGEPFYKSTGMCRVKVSYSYKMKAKRSVL